MLNEKINKILQNPIADKIFGLPAILISSYTIFEYFKLLNFKNFDIHYSLIVLNSCVVILTVLTRRTASRISFHWFHVLISWIRIYWSYVLVHFSAIYPTQTVFYQQFISFLLILSLTIIFFSRINLGRNIGILPAQRQLVFKGPYSYVRHPIHTGMILFFISFLLKNYSTFNLFMVSSGIIFFILKSFIEEKFLKQDVSYLEYCNQVKWKWIPGLI